MADDCENQWKASATALVEDCKTETEFTRRLPEALPELTGQFVGQHLKVRKVTELKDKRGAAQEMWSPQTMDLMFKLQVDPKMHVSANATGPVIAAVLEHLPGCVEVVDELNNYDVHGSCRGVKDSAGKALLMGSILTEVWVAMQLVGRRDEETGEWVRKSVGLYFDKTTHLETGVEEYTVKLPFYDNDGRHIVYQLALKQVQPEMNSEKTKVVKGAEMEWACIEAAFR